MYSVPGTMTKIATTRCSICRPRMPHISLATYVVLFACFLRAECKAWYLPHPGSAATAVSPAATAVNSEAASAKASAHRRVMLQDASSFIVGQPAPTATATAVQVGNSTVIVITPSGPPAAATSAAPAPVQVLVCPTGGEGAPGCSSISTNNTQNNAQNNTQSSPANSQSGSQTNSTADNQNNNSNTGFTASKTGPIVPENPRIDELPPKGLDLSKLKAPDTVIATMLLPGVNAETFVSKYSGYVDNITAGVAGTPAKVWNITVQQQQYIRQGSRRLLQRQQVLNVTMSLFAANPLIVWYRLSRGNAAANATISSSSSSQGDGCGTQYCSKLLAAGVPVDSSSISVSPNYAVLLAITSSTPTAPTPVIITTGFANSVANTTPSTATINDMLLKSIQDDQARLETVRKVVGSVVAAVIGLGFIALIWWKRESIRRTLSRCCGCKTSGDAVKPVDSRSGAAPATAAAAAAGSNASAKRKFSNGSNARTTSLPPSGRYQQKQQQQQQQRSKDVTDSGPVGNQEDLDNDLTQDNDIQVPNQDLPTPRRRFASFERRKFKAAAVAAAQSPITRPNRQTLTPQTSDASENADASSVGSLAGSNGAGGGSSTGVRRQIRNVTPTRQGSEDGAVSEGFSDRAA